jgi:cytidylate kinase
MPDLPHPVIAVDGTAASGKSTFSRSLAERLGYVYINTGAMYRGVTWYLQQRSIPLQDATAIALAFASVPLETTVVNDELAFRIAGIDPLPHVREAHVNEGVSLVAQVPEVRTLLVSEQQKLAQDGPLVMEGRDIGSVVFPETPYKFYVDASPEVRAMRRHKQGEDDVIAQRDAIDSSRKTSPLIRTGDAFFIDSSHVTVEEMVELALRHLAEHGLAAAGEISR